MRIANRSNKSGINQARKRMADMYFSSDLIDLRKSAFVNLERLGYFSPESKALQSFKVKVKNSMYGFDHPDAPEFLYFNVTTNQLPDPMYVITRHNVPTGKSFNMTKYRNPFIAGTSEDLIVGKAGHSVFVSDFKLILKELTSLTKAPIKRPVK